MKEGGNVLGLLKKERKEKMNITTKDDKGRGRKIKLRTCVKNASL